MCSQFLQTSAMFNHVDNGKGRSLLIAVKVGTRVKDEGSSPYRVKVTR